MTLVERIRHVAKHGWYNAPKGRDKPDPWPTETLNDSADAIDAALTHLKVARNMSKSHYVNGRIDTAMECLRQGVSTERPEPAEEEAR